MKSSVKTQTALVSSVVSLILCCAMLLGTTYAWFAKTIETENNVIESGSLYMDVELYYGNSWLSVERLAGNPIFGEDYLWQPGLEHTRYFRVSNPGDLALKWEASLVKAVHSSLDPSVAPYVIVDVKRTSPDGTINSDVSVYNGLTTIDEYIYGTPEVPSPYLARGSVEPVRFDDEGFRLNDFEYDYFAVTISLANDAPMEIAGKSLGEFDLRVVATQEISDYEEDSFGTDADEGAYFPTPVGTGEQLAAIFAGLEESGVITLDRDYDLAGYNWQPLSLTNGKQYTINGDGHTIKNLTVEGNYASLFSKVSNGKLVINDLSVEKASLTATETDAEGSAAAFVGFVDGSAEGVAVTLTNCHVKDSSIAITNETDGGYAGAFIGYNSGNNIKLQSCSAENVEITSAEGSVGGVIGHSSGFEAADIILEEVNVTNNSERDEDAKSKAGIFVGTINGEPVSVAGLEYSDCTAVQNGTAPDSRLVGRFVNGAIFELDGTVFTE